eukprot:TRINITY_DN71826_c0_g1_i1.p1 TRINITY_DN71826_c0_g1~~TRINITY_DN71826_c0_g1_i1.p1  ORF type:complete len:259 (-),score=66.11 TRINITY_DN71826_c0_g1_i1:220-996(-)
MSAAATGAAAAAEAAARYSGRFALHPLLPGVAQLAADSCTGRITPSWAPRAQGLLATMEKLSICIPRYTEFLKQTNRKDLKRAHVFMNDGAQAKLAEFYLCCALRLRPDAVDEAGQDAEKLLKLAEVVAREDVEPFFEECRSFVARYDEKLHERLNETTIWREVEDALFWHHSFEVADPVAYAAYREAALPPEAEWPEREDAAAVEALLARASQEVAEGGAARPMAERVYTSFLEASVTPVQGSIRTALIENGIIWAE